MAEAYDVAVIGAGHAGCEAALATARLGFKTIYLSSYTSIENVPGNIRCIRVRDVPELVRTLFK